MTWTSPSIPRRPKVAASSAISGSGWRPVRWPAGPDRPPSRSAYWALGMWPAGKAPAPQAGRESSKRQSTIAHCGSSRCSNSSCGSTSALDMDLSVIVGKVHSLPAFSAPCGSRYNQPLPACGGAMAIEVFWGSGSPCAWRVLLALGQKRLPYVSHLLQFSKQEHKSPQMLALNPRGRVPVLKDGDYVCFESLAILYYLDQKYPQPPIFGRTPEEAGTIMRVICEYSAYIEPNVTKIARAIFFDKEHADLSGDEITAAMHAVASEARTIEGRLSKSEWIVGDSYSAVDMVIYPGIQLLRRALEKPQAGALSSRFMPVEVNYPALGRWLGRVAAQPGYERTYPPHWRDS